MPTRKTAYVIGIAATVAIACSVSSEPVGQSGDAVSNGTILNLGTLAHPGSCMDARAAGTGNGTQIQEFLCNGSPAQSFAVAAAANGAVNLVNTNAQKCVDVSAAGTANGTKIQLFDCNGTSAQAFVLRPAGGGFVNIVNTNSNKCLDVAGDSPQDGTVVQLFDCNGTNAQRWNPTAIGVVASGGGASGGGGGVTGLAACSSAQRAHCNCPSTFSCCPTDGSCFQSADQVVFTQCKSNPASACSMSASAPAPGGGAAGGGSGATGGAPGGNAPPTGGTTPPPPTCAAAKPGPGDRVITVTNQCPGETISIGVNGGFVQDCNNGACPAGTTCSTGRTPPGCFFDFPTPTCGSSVLAPGASATYVLNAPPVGSAQIKWSGNIYASTHCASNGTGCQTAQCVTSANGKTVVSACPDGTGPEGPTTLAEFTLVPGGSDFYDVSSINGVNVPISMGPVGGTHDPSNPYTCGTAGGVTAAAGLQACSWNFNPVISLGNESTLLRAVAPGGAACSSDAQCGGGQVCGTALVLGGSTAVQSCGAQLGWWTADELCAYTGNSLGGIIGCNQGVAGQGTRANLYGCNGPNATSGFSTSANGESCGCPVWVVGGQTVNDAPGFTCHSDNPAWEAVAEPWAAFLKNACPTAYSFPFDDATSTFTCTTPNPSAANPNSTSYAITFCPGGKLGF
jgi:hypothetical protein